MRGSNERQSENYQPGQIVPESGIYTAVHLEHRAPHEVVAIRGEEFPVCRVCKGEVRFHINAAVPHMTHDFDLTGPTPSLNRRARAAAKGSGGQQGD